MMVAKEFIQKISRHLENLININTTSDFGNEIEAANYIKTELELAGVKSIIYEPQQGRGSLVTVLPGIRESYILFHTHLDTAKYEEGEGQWKVSASKAFVSEQFISGRGALDCKANVAVILTILQELALEGKMSRFGIIFMATADEENGGTWGTKWLLENNKIPMLTKVKFVIGEGGGFPIPYKNQIFFTVQTGEIIEKKVPENATTVLTNTDSGELKSELEINSILARGIELGFYSENTIAYFEALQVIARGRRIPQAYFYEGVESVFNNSYLDTKIVKEAQEMIKVILKKINKDYDILPIITPGYSDNRLFRENQIPTIGFFPLSVDNKINGIHGCNEYVTKDSLKMAYMVYREIIKY